MTRVLILALLCLLTACGRHDVTNKARADFQARNPRWKIVEAYSGKSDADYATVHVRYIDTSAGAFPAKPSILEMTMGYERTGDQWVLVSEFGSRFIGPTRWAQWTSRLTRQWSE